MIGFLLGFVCGMCFLTVLAAVACTGRIEQMVRWEIRPQPKRHDFSLN